MQGTITVTGLSGRQTAVSAEIQASSTTGGDAGQAPVHAQAAVMEARILQGRNPLIPLTWAAGRARPGQVTILIVQTVTNPLMADLVAILLGVRTILCMQMMFTDRYAATILTATSL